MVVSIVAALFLISGVFFFIVGVTGLIRFPDVYTRLHATTKCDTLGAGLILVALALHRGLDLGTGKIIVIVLFIWLTNPTAAHVIAKAALTSGFPFKEGSFDLDYRGRSPQYPTGELPFPDQKRTPPGGVQS